MTSDWLDWKIDGYDKIIAILDRFIDIQQLVPVDNNTNNEISHIALVIPGRAPQF